MKTYIHANILTGKHYSTKFKQEIYLKTDMVTKKCHYYFQISDNGIIKGMKECQKVHVLCKRVVKLCKS